MKFRCGGEAVKVCGDSRRSTLGSSRNREVDGSQDGGPAVETLQGEMTKAGCVREAPSGGGESGLGDPLGGLQPNPEEEEGGGGVSADDT